MSSLVALDIFDNEALVVTGSSDSEGFISISSVKKLSLVDSSISSDAPPSGDTTAEAVDSGSVENKLSTETTSETTDTSENILASDGETFATSNGTALTTTEELSKEDETTLAVVSAPSILYQKLSLPFKEQKKIDLVAPIQLQDIFPFELDGFVIDNLVLGEESETGYSILSTLVNEQCVATYLGRAQQIGRDPKLLTTKAASVTGLRHLFPFELTGTFALLVLNYPQCCLAIYVNDQLSHLREFSLSPTTEQLVLAAHINCSMARLCQDNQLEQISMFCVGPDDFYKFVTTNISKSAKRLDLSKVLIAEGDITIDSDSLAWAAGLFALEAQKKKTPLVNFRLGKYAYKPTWGNFLEAVKGEFVYIILAVVMLVCYYGANAYFVENQLSEIDQQISALISQANISETVPNRREAEFLESKVAEVEEQLRGVGSLSNLSPLDSLRELSIALEPSLDITVDGLSLSQLRVGFHGSVLDIPTVGKLERILNDRSDKFCKVKVDPKGKDSGSTRVSFSAEIELCE
jgi:hypothetical protein